MKRSLILFALLLVAGFSVNGQITSSFTLGTRLQGATLPVSCTDKRRLFTLTTTDGANVAGLYRCNGSNYVLVGDGVGTGDVVGPASSVDSEIVLFSGTGGKTLKRATTTGLLKGTAGVIGAAVAGDLPTGIDAAKIGGGGVSSTEYDWIGTLTSNAQDQFNLKAPLASPAFTGAPTVAGTITQTSASATAFESGPNGSTNPVLRLVNSTASQADGISITGGAAGAGTTIAALSSGSNSGFTFTPKGTGGFTLSSGQFLGANGSASAPTIAPSGNPDTGIYFPGALYVAITNDNSLVASFRASLGVGVLSGNALYFDSGAGAGETFLRSRAAANLNLGAADAASPVAQTLSVQGSRAGTDTNVAGGNFTIKSGNGTGNSTGSSLIFQTPVAVASGTGAQTQTTALTLQNTNATVAGSLTTSQTAGIVGTTTNNNANAGSVGEYIESLIASGSAVSLTTATPANVTSIPLTAGDWDVSANINIAGGTATYTQGVGGISTTTATLPTDGSEVYSGAQFTLLSVTDGVTISRMRISVAGSTPVYLVVRATFTAGTMTAYGKISARRVR